MDNQLFVIITLLIIAVYFLTISKQFNEYKDDIIQCSIRETNTAYKSHLYEANKQLNSEQFTEFLINEMKEVEDEHSVHVSNKKNI